MKAIAVCLLLLCGCAGDPFEVADGDGSAPLADVDGGLEAAAADASLEADAPLEGEARALDGRTASGDAPAAADVVPETTPPVSDDGGGNDAPAEAFADARAPEASTADSAPPPALCCIGAGQASCSASVRCYGPASSCSATLQYLPDGGQYQTATCTGTPWPCSTGCAAGSACLWAGPVADQWLPGSIEACP